MQCVGLRGLRAAVLKAMEIEHDAKVKRIPSLQLVSEKKASAK